MFPRHFSDVHFVDTSETTTRGRQKLVIFPRWFQVSFQFLRSSRAHWKKTGGKVVVFSLILFEYLKSYCGSSGTAFSSPACGAVQELRKYKENEKDTEVLMSALSAMQEKTQHLENSLSAETRIKLDLFSALGDAKRQLEIAQGKLAVRHAAFFFFFFPCCHQRRHC